MTKKPKKKRKNELLKVRKHILVGTDHPYSLGAPICLVTEKGMFDWPSVATDVIDEYMESVVAGLSSADAACIWDSNANAHVLVFKPSSRGYCKNLVRQLELVVHETSHLVDNILRFIGEPDQKGEVRAYLHDWIAGRCFAILPSSGSKKKKRKL